jgi:iron complex transport system ATP-binding protein
VSIAVQNISVQFGERKAVDCVSFTAQQGSVLALLGPNGSGKTTLLRSMAGFQKHSGACLFDGKPVDPGRIGYMPQDYNGGGTLTVLELLLLARAQSRAIHSKTTDFDAAADILSGLNIMDLAPLRLGELSGGQRQVAFLAQALVRDPAYLLLDEPISALDLRHQLDVMSAVRHLTHERQITTIVVLHDLNIASRYADWVVLLSQGCAVAEGPPDTTLTRTLIAEVFTVDTESLTTSDGKRVTALRHTLAHPSTHDQPRSL